MEGSPSWTIFELCRLSLNAEGCMKLTSEPTNKQQDYHSAVTFELTVFSHKASSSVGPGSMERPVRWIFPLVVWRCGFGSQLRNVGRRWADFSEDVSVC